MSNVFSGVFTAGNKPELATVNGYRVLRFNAANTVGYGEKKQTVWVSVSHFGNVARLVEMIEAGSKLFISGELTQREYQGKMYLDLNARLIDVLGGGNNGGKNTR